MTETKRCIDCLQDLPLTSFTWSGRYLRSYCRPCSNERSRRYAAENKRARNIRLQAWRKANPEAARAKDARARLMRKYRITPADVEAMRVAQDGRCLLCTSNIRSLVVDHCHATGRVRGLLCASCNTIVGQVELVPELLGRIGAYLAHANDTSGLASNSSTSA